MRSIWRAGLTFIAFTSLLLAIAAAALWVRGFWAQDEWRWSATRPERDVIKKGDTVWFKSTWYADSGRGGLALGRGMTWVDEDQARGRDPSGRAFAHSAYPSEYPIYAEVDRPQKGFQHTFGRFQVRRDDETESQAPGIGPDGRPGMIATRIPLTMTQSQFTTPLWICIVLFLILPALWLLVARGRWRVADRRRRGECLKCGYQLRAGGIGNRCPECGTPASPMPERHAATL